MNNDKQCTIGYVSAADQPDWSMLCNIIYPMDNDTFHCMQSIPDWCIHYWLIHIFLIILDTLSSVIAASIQYIHNW